MKISQLFETNESCPHCGGHMTAVDEMMEGPKDACYYKIKASAKVWPSAYASGRLVQCRKKGAANYGSKSEDVAEGLIYSGDTWQDVLYRINVLNDIFGDQKDLAASFEPASQPEWIPFRDRILRSRTVLDTYAKVKQLANMNVPLTDVEIEMLADVAWDGGGGPVEPAGNWGESDYNWLEDLYAQQFAVVQHLLDQKAQSRNQNKTKSGQTVHEQGVAEGLPQTLRKFVPGYAKREIDKKMDDQKFGRTDVDKDANYYRYKKIQDKIKDADVAEVFDGDQETGTTHKGGRVTKVGNVTRHEKTKYDDETSTGADADMIGTSTGRRVKARLDYDGNEDATNEGLEDLHRIVQLSGLTLSPDEQFDMIEDMVQQLAEQHGVDAETIWQDFESVDDEELLSESAAWRNSSGKSKKGGLNAKGVASYRRENPGSKLQMAVTTKPSKLKPGSKAAKRRKSFCARMGGNKGPMKKPNGDPTRKALALRKWNC